MWIRTHRRRSSGLSFAPFKVESEPLRHFCSALRIARCLSLTLLGPRGGTPWWFAYAAPQTHTQPSSPKMAPSDVLHHNEKDWDPASPNVGVPHQHNHPGMYPGPYDDHDATTQGSHDDDAESTAPPSMRRQRTARASEDLRRTASNVLSTIASRITTRGWPEPPPPPDGGAKAWTQVACVRLTIKLFIPRILKHQGSSELKTSCLIF